MYTVRGVCYLLARDIHRAPLSCAPQTFPSDGTKIRSVLGGWLYAYEIPQPPSLVPVAASDSPDEMIRRRRLDELRRERTLSLQHAEEAKEKAGRARARVEQARAARARGETVEEGEEAEAVGEEGVEPAGADSEAPVVVVEEAVDGSSREASESYPREASDSCPEEVHCSVNIVEVTYLHVQCTLYMYMYKHTVFYIENTVHMCTLCV